MRAAVVGTGAMGSLMSLLLDGAGMEVVVYERREERLAGIRMNGIRVRGVLGGEVAPRIGIAGEAAEPYDIMILAVSATETGDALRPLSPFVHRDTIYISMQDGNAVSVLAGLVGEERAFGALGWVSACETPAGEVEVEDCRSLVLGAFVPGREERLVHLVEVMEAACPGKARVTDDLEGEIWKRLEAAAAVSGLCTIAGTVPQEARALGDLDALCGDAAEECRQAASTIGRGPDTSISPWEDAVWGRLKPPMLRDIEAGRKTEAAWMNGRIVEQARAAGIAVPVQSAMLTLVKEMESGLRRPGEAALNELSRRIAEEQGMSLS